MRQVQGMKDNYRDIIGICILVSMCAHLFFGYMMYLGIGYDVFSLANVMG